jgi:hypothetical protein
MQTINPYSTLSPKIKTALDGIIAALPLNPTFDNLNDAVFNAQFAPTPPTDSLTVLYIKSVLPNVYNSYKTSPSVPLLRGEGGRDAHTTNASIQDGSVGARGCSAPLLAGEGSGVRSLKQQVVINELLTTLRTTSTESIPQLLAATDEKIATSGLPFMEQTPLFVATTTGKAVYEYWLQNIPQPSSWAAYMVNPNITPQAMDAVNYNNVSNWVSAAMQGALLGWGSTDLPKIDYVDMSAATIGAVGLGAGKVVFKW